MTNLSRWVPALLLVACGGLAPAPPQQGAPDPRNVPPAQELQGRNLEGPAASDDAPKAGTAAGGSERAAGGIFTATTGDSVDLAAAYAERGAVVVFYRGHWCTQCRKQLVELEGIAGTLTTRGFDIYAISTDAPEQSAELATRLRLSFALLNDTIGASTAAWGVYSTEHDLARPAVFIVEPGGTIAYRYVSDTPSDRPSPAQLLELTAPR